MQRYFAKEKNNNTFILNDNDLYHISTVMRMKNNDLIEVVYDNKLYICQLNIENKNIEVIIKEEVKEKVNSLNVNLILPLLKEQKMDLIIQKATELGVSKLIFLNTERTVVKLDLKKIDSKLDRWYKIAKEASEQSKRLDIPLIEVLSGFKDLEGIKGLNLVCDTKENLKSIKNALKSSESYDTINIVVGPEGGLSNKEIEYLNKIGFKSITFGSRILRVETVPIYLLSIINYEMME